MAEPAVVDLVPVSFDLHVFAKKTSGGSNYGICGPAIVHDPSDDLGELDAEVRWERAATAAGFFPDSGRGHWERGTSPQLNFKKSELYPLLEEQLPKIEACGVRSQGDDRNRSSSFSTLGRIIYRVDAEKREVTIVKLTTDHDYGRKKK